VPQVLQPLRQARMIALAQRSNRVVELPRIRAEVIMLSKIWLGAWRLDVSIGRPEHTVEAVLNNRRRRCAIIIACLASQEGTQTAPSVVRLIDHVSTEARTLVERRVLESIVTLTVWSKRTAPILNQRVRPPRGALTLHLAPHCIIAGALVRCPRCEWRWAEEEG
jgi:hypothetical protein